MICWFFLAPKRPGRNKVDQIQLSRPLKLGDNWQYFPCASQKELKTLTSLTFNLSLSHTRVHMRACTHTHTHTHTSSIEICSILTDNAAEEMSNVTLILISVQFLFFFSDILQDFSLCIYDAVITLNEVYISFSI